METTTVDVWVVVNADEESEVHATEEDAHDHGLKGPCRVIKIAVTVAVPKAVEVAVTVAAEPDAATVAVA